MNLRSFTLQEILGSLLGHVATRLNLRYCIMRYVLVSILGQATTRLNLRSCILRYMLTTCWLACWDMLPPMQSKGLAHYATRRSSFLGNVTPHTNIVFVTLHYTLIIMLGHASHPHELKIRYIARHVGHHFGTCFPSHEHHVLHST